MFSSIQIYSDGGARGNPGPAAIGVLLCDAKGNFIKDYREVIGEATNNIAEYTAVIVALDLALQIKATSVKYFMDSELAAKQLTGEYRVKTPHIQSLYATVKEKEKHFERIEYRHVPRTHEKIRYVDKLVNQALNEAGY